MPQPPLHYHVSLEAPQDHEFQVTLTVPPLAAQTALTFTLPAWTPGSYLIRDFSRHVYDLEFRVGGRPVAAIRLDKQSWRVATEGEAVEVRYRVFAFEPSVRTSFLDDRRAFWNGANLFFRVDEIARHPCQVTVGAPAGWRVSTPLSVRKGGLFHAPDYDTLVDAPFEVGTHALHRFRVGKTWFEVAWQGATNADVPRLLEMLATIARTTGKLFGGFPFERYLFIIHALPARGGGLEHANGCTLDIASHAFEDEKAYQAFAELAAHEFFHAWNVKRIHDRALGPFDYTKENYTRLLWFHEGFTSYMESIILRRAGLLAKDRYLKDLAEAWQRYLQRPGRNVTPLAELSFEAWIKQYKPAENHVNRMVSYYEKGEWAGLVLDLLLLRATAGKRGLPHLFERLWRNHARHGHPIDEAILRAECEALAGKPMDGFFRRYIHGTQELPVPQLLRKVGVVVENKSPAEAEDHDPTKRRRLLGYCGLTLAGQGPSQGALVKNVVPGSPAHAAGLTYGDELVAVAGIRVTAATAPKRLADAGPKERVAVAFFRADTLRDGTLVVGKNPHRCFAFTPDLQATASARDLRQAWLG